MNKLIIILSFTFSNLSFAQLTVIITEYSDSLQKNVSTTKNYPEDFAEFIITNVSATYKQYTNVNTIDSILIYSESIDIDSVIYAPMQNTYFDHDKEFVFAISNIKEGNVLGDNYLIIAFRFKVFQEFIEGEGLKIIKE